MKKFIVLLSLCIAIVLFATNVTPKYSVNKKTCIGCTICVKKCPVNAISMKDGKAFIDTTKCISCGICEKVCPVNAIDTLKTKTVLDTLKTK